MLAWIILFDPPLCMGMSMLSTAQKVCWCISWHISWHISCHGAQVGAGRTKLAWAGHKLARAGLSRCGRNTSRPALFLEASNWQRWGVLCKPPLPWPYSTST